MIGCRPVVAPLAAAVLLTAGCSGKPSSTSSPPPPVSSSLPLPSSDSTTSAGGSFAMPNEVGRVLQTAQDDMQSVSGNALFVTRSEDATGQGRAQLNDRDWKVCRQSVAAGAPVDPSTEITFSVVKLNETCPG